MKTLNKALLVGGVIAALSLTQCDVATVAVSQLLFRPKVVDFPLGEGATISYPITSWIEKPYIITLNTEYINSKKAWGEKQEMPYHFSAKCYHLKKNEEVLFFENTYVVRDVSHEVGNEIYTRHENILDDGRGWEPNNPNNPYADGRSAGLGGFDLSSGKYRCDFKDESPPEIKAMLKEAGIARTAVTIYPSKLIFH